MTEHRNCAKMRKRIKKENRRKTDGKGEIK